MNIVWLTKSAAKYKMDLLDEIGKKVNLTILFIEHKNKNRAAGFYSDLNGHYQLVQLKSFKQADEYIKNADIFVDSYYASKWGFYCTGVARKYHVHTILQADGGIAVKRNILVEMAISCFMNRHEFILSSSTFTDDYFKYYLKNNMKKTYHYRISSLHEQDIQKNILLSALDK